jgi:Ni/Fe-hydrogenase subunit HybB-like protein
MFLLEKALVGRPRYWNWIALLSIAVLIGFLAFLREEEVGLVVTGLSRDVIWGLYIAQFIVCVGLGASAIVVVLPYYLHDCKAFGKITILGEILGMCSVIMAMLFIFASMGQPMRVLNVLLYPHPNSLIFWDLSVLSTYVLLNAIITIALVKAAHEGVEPPKWIKPVIILSIPWAISIHTVTAFLFSGLAGRPFWMTPLLAPRFLVSAFASGPALLILLVFLLKWLDVLDAGVEAIGKLAVIVTYFTLANVFFIGVELFTVFYSRIPDHVKHFQYLYLGVDGNYSVAVWMWLSALLSIVGLSLLLVPKWRTNPVLLPLACASVFLSVWLDKGLGMILGGFVPSPLGNFTRYVPTMPEWTVVIGIWALGALMITVLYKIALSVRQAH